MPVKDHPPNDWLRLYTDVLRDPKLRQLPASARWCWIGLLVLATESPEPGRLLRSDGMPITVADIASTCDVGIDATKQALLVFHREDMLHRDGKVVVVTHFLDRQPRVKMWLEGRGPAWRSFPAREGAVPANTTVAQPAPVAIVQPPLLSSIPASPNSACMPLLRNDGQPPPADGVHPPPPNLSSSPDLSARQPGRAYGSPAYWNSVSPFRAVVDAVGFAFGAETDGEWSQATECAKVLCSCDPPVRAEQVAALVGRWNELFPGATCTPRAIANYAGRLRSGKALPVQRGKRESSSEQMARIIDGRRNQP